MDVPTFVGWLEKHKSGRWMQETDDKNENVLHLAIEYNVPEAATLAITAAVGSGAAVEAKNAAGNCPLHLALIQLDLANSGASEAVVLALFAAWPDAVKEKNNQLNIPLHLALAHTASEAVVLALFAAWPDAVKEKNNRHNTPLHLALAHNASEAVVRTLHAAWPEGMQKKDKFGQTQLQLVLNSKTLEAETKRMLLASLPVKHYPTTGI